MVGKFRCWVICGVICFALVGRGAAADAPILNSPPSLGGGPIGGGSGSLACALTGCEIAKLLVTTLMPTGSATYAGRLSYATENAAGVIKTTNADLDLTANFNARSIVLELSNFNDGQLYQGSAAGNATIINSQFSGSYLGNLSQDSATVIVAGTLTGQFRGNLAQALDGDVTATGAGGTGGDAYGRFFANRQ